MHYRIAVIDKANAGYGAAMNDGLRAASGEYVAFLESDDAIAPHAYERLSDLADAHGVDIIKGNYYNLIGSGSDRELEEKPLTSIKERYGKSFRPLSEKWSFYIPMMNCLGLFRLSFLRRNAILHQETPGASHQDLGFWFQTLCCADSMLLIDEPFYMYRQDNAGSSIHDETKAIFKLREYDRMLEFLDKRPSLKEEALSVYCHRKFGSCMFAYDHSELSLRLPFLRKLSESYRAEMSQGDYDGTLFSADESKTLKGIVDDPDSYYVESLSGVAAISSSALSAFKKENVRLQAVIRSLCHEPQHSENLTKAESADSCTLSVIVPVFNTGDYLSECLGSILAQPVSDMEVICVNDGSTDGSGAILEAFRERDARVKVIYQDNCGQGVARNKGLDVASGKYVRFVDSDDLVPPDSFDVLISRMEVDDLDILLFDGDVIVETAKPMKDDIYGRKRSYGYCVSGEDLFVGMASDGAYRVQPGLALYKRALLQQNEVRFPEYVVYEDNVFMAHALLAAKKAGHVNEPYYTRRYREGSTMTSAVSSYNVVSYYRVLLEMALLSRSMPLSVSAETALADEMMAIVRTTRRLYEELSPVQKQIASTYTPVERLFFNLMISEKNNGASTGGGRHFDREIERIKTSNSWKIGRAVTYIPRLAKRIAKRHSVRS